MESLRLVPRDDDLDVGDPLDELCLPDPPVAATLEVVADAGAQRLRLPDVQHLAPLVAKQVDAGAPPEARRGRLERLLAFSR